MAKNRQRQKAVTRTRARVARFRLRWLAAAVAACLSLTGARAEERIVDSATTSTNGGYTLNAGDKLTVTGDGEINTNHAAGIRLSQTDNNVELQNGSIINAAWDYAILVEGGVTGARVIGNGTSVAGTRIDINGKDAFVSLTDSIFNCSEGQYGLINKNKADITLSGKVNLTGTSSAIVNFDSGSSGSTINIVGDGIGTSKLTGPQAVANQSDSTINVSNLCIASKSGDLGTVSAIYCSGSFAVGNQTVSVNVSDCQIDASGANVINNVGANNIILLNNTHGERITGTRIVRNLGENAQITVKSLLAASGNAGVYNTGKATIEIDGIESEQSIITRNGNVIENNGSGASGSVIYLKNITLTSTSGDVVNTGILSSQNGAVDTEFVVDNAKFFAETSCVIASCADNLTAKITNSEITAKRIIRNSSVNADISITDSTIQTAAGCDYGIYSDGANAKLALSGDITLSGSNNCVNNTASGVEISITGKTNKLARLSSTGGYGVNNTGKGIIKLQYAAVEGKTIGFMTSGDETQITITDSTIKGNTDCGIKSSGASDIITISGSTITGVETADKTKAGVRISGGGVNVVVSDSTVNGNVYNTSANSNASQISLLKSTVNSKYSSLETMKTAKLAVGSGSALASETVNAVRVTGDTNNSVTLAGSLTAKADDTIYIDTEKNVINLVHGVTLSNTGSDDAKNAGINLGGKTNYLTFGYGVDANGFAAGTGSDSPTAGVLNTVDNEAAITIGTKIVNSGKTDAYFAAGNTIFTNYDVSLQNVYIGAQRFANQNLVTSNITKTIIDAVAGAIAKVELQGVNLNAGSNLTINRGGTLSLDSTSSLTVADQAILGGTLETNSATAISLPKFELGEHAEAVISGTGAVTLNKTGALEIAAADAESARALTIANANVTLDNGGAGIIVGKNGTLELQKRFQPGGDEITVSGGTLRVLASGTTSVLEVSDGEVFADAGATVNVGTLSVPAAATACDIRFTGSGNISVANAPAEITLGGGGQTQSLTFDNANTAVTGIGKITVNGNDGQLAILQNTSSLESTEIDVAGGMFTAGRAGTAVAAVLNSVSGGAVRAAAGSTVKINTLSMLASDLTLSGTAADGAGSIVLPSSGTLAVNGGKTLIIQDAAVFVPSGIDVESGGTLTVNRTLASGDIVLNGGTLNANNDAGTVTVAEASGGEITGTGAVRIDKVDFAGGTLANNNTGAASLQIGTLAVGDGKTGAFAGSGAVTAVTADLAGTLNAANPLTLQTVMVASGKTAVINNSQTTTIGSGAIDGGLANSGGGELAITGNVALNGSGSSLSNLTLNSGATLDVNGDSALAFAADGWAGAVNLGNGARLTASGATVDGTLSGNGSIIGDLTVAGVVAPGAGGLAITGDAVFNDGSQIRVGLGATESADRKLTVAGALNLDAGARISVSAAREAQGAALVSAGSLGGADVLPELEPSAVYDFACRWVGNELLVDSAKKPTVFHDTASAADRGLGSVLDSLMENHPAELDRMFAALGRISSPEQLREAMAELNGSRAAAAMAQTMQTAVHQSNRILLHRLEVARWEKFTQSLLAGIPAQAVGRRERARAQAGGNPADGDFVGPLPPADIAPRWGGLFKAYGGFGHQDASGSLSGYEFAGVGAMVGIDRMLADNLRFGFLADYSYNTNSLYSGSGYGHDHLLRFGAYSSFDWDGFFWDCSPTFGIHMLENTRKIRFMGETVKNARTAFDVNLLNSVGYRFELPHGVMLTPQYSLSFTYFRDPESKETGSYSAPRLKTGARDEYSLVQDIRLKFGKLLKLNDECFILPEVWGGWEHEYFSAPASVTMAFAAAPGAEWKSETARPAADRAVFGAGITTLWGKHWALNGTFQQKLWDGGSDSNFALSVNFSF